MELIEVERQSPIGFYGLTFRCSSCGAQLNDGYNCQGMFGFDRQALNLWFHSKFCLKCGHKWIQDKIVQGFDLCDLFGVSKDQINDDCLVECLKKYKYLPADFQHKPVWDRLHHGDTTGGYMSSHWFVNGIDRRKLDGRFAIL